MLLDSSSNRDFVTRTAFERNLLADIQSSARSSRRLPEIRDYRISHQIGEGAFGSVWLAEEMHLPGVFRAIKVLHSSIGSGREPSAFAERELAGLRAYQTQAKDHPNLLQILHVGQYSESSLEAPADTASVRTFYVMEIADHAGGAQPYLPADYRQLSLGTLIRCEGQISVSRSIEYLRQLLAAIDHLHRHGIFHHDVKPANLLFVRGVLKLADLGLMSSSNGQLCGTPEYIPPESNYPDDLYAAGIVFYEMITGLSAKGFPEWPAALDPRRSTVLRESRACILRACNRDPKARFQSPGEFLSAIERVERGDREPASESGLSRRRALMVPVACLGGIAVGGSAAALALSADKSPQPSRDAERLREYRHYPADGSLNPITNSSQTFLFYPGSDLVAPRALVWEDKTVTFFDLQACVEGDELRLAGGYQLRMEKNPCPYEVDHATQTSGMGAEIQLFALVDVDLAGRVAGCTTLPDVPYLQILYWGQPTCDPPTIGRFFAHFDLDRIPADQKIEVRLIVTAALASNLKDNLLAAINDLSSALLFGHAVRRGG